MTTPQIEHQLIPLLRGVGLFSRCSDADLRMVARRAAVRGAGRRAASSPKWSPGPKVAVATPPLRLSAPPRSTM